MPEIYENIFSYYEKKILNFPARAAYSSEVARGVPPAMTGKSFRATLRARLASSEGLVSLTCPSRISLWGSDAAAIDFPAFNRSVSQNSSVSALLRGFVYYAVPVLLASTFSGSNAPINLSPTRWDFVLNSEFVLSRRL
ncbi:hypothetical protein EVAR_7574_1 [Eumeta japonica]|uniref:Uncharacterized protein n=1 Tax=Eumeta variegata TaxID=151549 RepID=A0A4C1VPI6_EUMVA|nr:hypothetical protein EVAR_7574_1 [Eumeta japonica]